MSVITALRGASALSPFRVEKLLQKAQKIGLPTSQLSSQYWYFVSSPAALSDETVQKLQALLAAQCVHAPEMLGNFFLITPRIGTISPWASKATDIAHNCGLQEIERIERGMAVMLSGSLNNAQRQKWADLLHDRMTESVLSDFQAAEKLFSQHNQQTFETIDVLNGGKHVLEQANQNMGLALSPDEIDYLIENYQNLNRNPTDVELMMFAQANSEHCRHKIFNADFVLDGKKQEKSLFRMIRDTHEKSPNGTVVAYKDNSSVIEGANIARFYPNPNHQAYEFHEENTHIIMKVETHNHPTAIAPFAGAATGAGGEIRDEGATGRGSRPKAGLTGYTVSNLHIPDFKQKWEIPYGKPHHIASPLDIMMDAPIGGAAFNNEFGRPNLLGYFRTFEMAHSGSVRGFHKPIMIAGGLGNIQAEQTHKYEIPAGALLIQLGGKGMLIGLGGGAASSVDTGSNAADLDFNSVQRGNPEIERRAQEVIDRCWQLGADKNPIISIHDVGAGGLSNAFPELVNDAGRGAVFQLRDVPLEEHGLSPMQIWCNEAQERYVLAILPENLELFTKICERERCPFAVVGTATDDGHLQVRDDVFGNNPVDLPLNVLLGKPPKTTRTDNKRLPEARPFNSQQYDLTESVYRVMRLPAVASKHFLITIGDRSVGGMTHRDQMVGKYQVPVADCAVTLMGFQTHQGEAMSMGEKPQLALFDAPASGRMCVGEAMTNIAAVNIGDIGNIKLSANWMAACGVAGEDANLYRTVQSVSQFCQTLGVSIPVGKDSLSMKTVWQENGENKAVVSPLSLIVSAFAPVQDVRKTVTPDLKPIENSVLLLIDLGMGKSRMGGSALSQVWNDLSGESPDIDAGSLKKFFDLMQILINENKILAYHDRSDGGLLATVAEMAFAGRCGIVLDLNEDFAMEKLVNNVSDLDILFNEELGAVLQIRAEDLQYIQALFENHDFAETIYQIGAVEPNHTQMRIESDENHVFDLLDLQKAWQETSYQIQKLRDNPACADSEFALIGDEKARLFADLPFDLKEDIVAPYISGSLKPKIAILREQGVNGHLEMAAAFHRAGFQAIDVHMSDLMANRVKLSDMQMLAACGGFSYGDVLGAGEGWAKSILFHPRLRDEFAEFFNNPNTLTLGVCNGCQMVSNLAEIIPNAQNWAKFKRNQSEQFEARLSMVQVSDSPSLILREMRGAMLPVVVSHGEGRADFGHLNSNGAVPNDVNIALQYVDGWGQVTQEYPLNPNGSPNGIAGITTTDGRVTIMMPHPERVFRTAQMSWCPDEWREHELSAWYRLFAGARKALG